MPSSERKRREEAYKDKLVNFFFKKNIEYHRNKDVWKKPELQELFSIISHDNDLNVQEKEKLKEMYGSKAYSYETDINRIKKTYKTEYDEIKDEYDTDIV